MITQRWATGLSSYHGWKTEEEINRPIASPLCFLPGLCHQVRGENNETNLLDPLPHPQLATSTVSQKVPGEPRCSFAQGQGHFSYKGLDIYWQLQDVWVCTEIPQQSPSVGWTAQPFWGTHTPYLITSSFPSPLFNPCFKISSSTFLFVFK